MPNIKIYGYHMPSQMPTHLLREYQEVETKIRQVISDLGLSRKTVTTFIPSDVDLISNFPGNPYIEVCSTQKNERLEIAAQLRKAIPWIDIDVISIEKFLPGNAKLRPR